MKERFDLSAYYPPVDGNKPRYRTVGSLFVETGTDSLNGSTRYSIKLDLIPVGPEWQGWINAFPPREKEEKKETKASRTTPANFDDDVPF